MVFFIWGPLEQSLSLGRFPFSPWFASNKKAPPNFLPPLVFCGGHGALHTSFCPPPLLQQPQNGLKNPPFPPLTKNCWRFVGPAVTFFTHGLLLFPVSSPPLSFSWGPVSFLGGGQNTQTRVFWVSPGFPLAGWGFPFPLKLFFSLIFELPPPPQGSGIFPSGILPRFTCVRPF